MHKTFTVNDCPYLAASVSVADHERLEVRQYLVERGFSSYSYVNGVTHLRVLPTPVAPDGAIEMAEAEMHDRPCEIRFSIKER
ncbi:MAG: hypothetical protein IPP97_27430 [Candidatus Obscuribacter sp.]|nr:hypothetical protein [Candidatus Obscuribacter sp.]